MHSAGPNRHVVVVGAGGDMASFAVDRLARTHAGLRFTLTDIDEARVQALTQRLPPGRASTRRLDLFDDTALAHVIQNADLVVCGAGPSLRTTGPVVRACIAAGVDYLDFADDAEAFLDALPLHDEASSAEVRCLLSCGISPGYTNLQAAEAMSRLDVVHEVDLAWVAGDEGAHDYQRAVVSHLVHMLAGEAISWKDGAEHRQPGFRETTLFPFSEPLGVYRVFETNHPEAVQLARLAPDARRIRVLGGMHPPAVNALCAAVGEAVRAGQVDHDVAVAWFQDVMADRTGPWKPWPAALAGLRKHVQQGYLTRRQAGRFLSDSSEGGISRIWQDAACG